ncbi:MAG: hypothetical protein EA409_10065 [Saprospirales bacterium]|nr:MAG: hypothetical protein EA409_10065 [Saprospirales bacterium]
MDRIIGLSLFLYKFYSKKYCFFARRKNKRQAALELFDFEKFAFFFVCSGNLRNLLRFLKKQIHN